MFGVLKKIKIKMILFPQEKRSQKKKKVSFNVCFLFILGESARREKKKSFVIMIWSGGTLVWIECGLLILASASTEKE